MADYANKTVTIEPHPHTTVRQISIHPCNHAKVMKKIIDTIVLNGDASDGNLLTEENIDNTDTHRF